MKIKSSSIISSYHIPKTAGTRFDEVLIKNIYKKTMGMRMVTRTPLGTGRSTQIFSKNKLICTSGHQEYKLCNEHSDVVFILFLRNPVNRVVSHYWHNKQHGIIKDCTLDEIFLNNPSLYFSPKASNAALKKSGFFPCNFYYENIYWASNYYTRALGGAAFSGPRNINKKECDKIINGLKSNTLTFQFGKKIVTAPVVIGITEKFDESIQFIAKVFDWKNIDKNRTSNKGKYEMPSKKIIDKIKERNLLDIKIYKTALEVFENQQKK